MCLDVIRLIALAVALRCGAREFVGIGEDDLFACACLNQAMMYRLCHGRWARVFALDDVLARCLLKGPYDGLGGNTL